MLLRLILVCGSLEGIWSRMPLMGICWAWRVGRLWVGARPEYIINLHINMYIIIYTSKIHSWTFHLCIHKANWFTRLIRSSGHVVVSSPNCSQRAENTLLWAFGHRRTKGSLSSMQQGWHGWPLQTSCWHLQFMFLMEFLFVLSSQSNQ